MLDAEFPVLRLRPPLWAPAVLPVEIDVDPEDAAFIVGAVESFSDPESAFEEEPETMLTPPPIPAEEVPPSNCRSPPWLAPSPPITETVPPAELVEEPASRIKEPPN
jgi:hypothetical protein